MNFVPFLLLFFSTTSVHSLECYVSDLAALEANNMNAGPIIQDCKDYYQADHDDISFRCYTVKAISERATINIQGCTVKDDCVELTNSVEHSLEKFNRNYEVSCEECSHDLCNSGIKNFIIINRWFNVRIIVVSVVIIVGVFAIGTTVICYFKKKSTKSYSQLMKM